VLNTANCGALRNRAYIRYLNTTGPAVEIAKRDLLDAEKDLKEYLNKSAD
jgi:hypothetical protein